MDLKPWDRKANRIGPSIAPQSGLTKHAHQQSRVLFARNLRRRRHPRAGVMRGASGSTPMRSRILRMSALKLMNAMMRSGPRPPGRSKGTFHGFDVGRALSAAHR